MYSKETLDRLNREQEAIIRIKLCLPGATDEMLEEFLSSLPVSLTTVRIWAEQGVLAIANNKIIKVQPASISHEYVARQLRIATSPRIIRWALRLWDKLRWGGDRHERK